MDQQQGSDSAILDIIRDGDHVIVERIFEDKSRIAKVAKESNFHWGNLRTNIWSLIGAEFDSIYEFDNKDRKFKAVKLTSDELFDVIGVSSNVNVQEVDESKDNRFLNDDGRSQKLSRDEIESLKSSGASNQKIVESLIENSSTFKDKNAFAQEKYLKKKQQKYSNFFKIRRPTVRLLLEMFSSTYPMKILNMRIDSLSQMLTACNVRSGGHYGVVDNQLGLVTAAVLERLYGDGQLPSDHRVGTCVQIYTDPGPMSSWRQCIEYLNYKSETLERHLVSYQIKQAYNLLHGIEEEDKNSKASLEATNGSTNEAGDNSSDVDPKRRKLDERTIRRNARKVEEIKAKEILATKQLDGLLVVIKQVEPMELMDILLEFLAPSAPFAVFCYLIEPLTELAIELKRRQYANVRLSESWLRKYQVLPGRTRPDMNMSGSGGYLLTGTKVL